MSNSQLNKLKCGIKTNTEVTLKISSNVVGDSNDENNFPHKLLLINTQISKLCKAFANNFSANIKLAKTQLHNCNWTRTQNHLVLKRTLNQFGQMVECSFKN